MCSRTITDRPRTPWYTDELQEAKRWERKYLKSGLTVDKQIYQDHCRQYRSLLDSTKTEYFKRKITELNHHHLFKFVDEMLNVKHSPVLPKHDSTEDLLEMFSQYFENKILDLRRELTTIAIPENWTETTESSHAAQFFPTSIAFLERK